jgi:diacylglycerol kinase (ATP)
MPRRILILANPISGGGRGARAATALAHALTTHGAHADLHLTTHAGNARERAASTSSTTHDAIVGVGGDGTLNEILNGLVDRDVALALYPCGTANVLAAELRTPRTPDAFAKLLCTTDPTPLPIATANGRRFVLFAGVGFDAAIVRRVEDTRRGPLGKLRWIAPVCHVIRNWPLRALSLTTDSGETRTGCTQILVTRVRNYGGTMHLPVGDLRDPHLHVLAFRQRTRIAWALTSLRAIAGRLRVPRDVEHLIATTVTITAEGAPAHCQIDGDTHHTTPLHVALDPQPVRMFGLL